MGFVLKLIFSSVDGVMSKIRNLLSRVTQEITSPLRNMVNDVTGGIWKGDGADRFVNEMTSEVIPSLMAIVGVNTSFIGAVQKSMEAFRTAEKTATSKANDLLDVFGNIFK